MLALLQLETHGGQDVHRGLLVASDGLSSDTGRREFSRISAFTRGLSTGDVYGRYHQFPVLFAVHASTVHRWEGITHRFSPIALHGHEALTPDRSAVSRILPTVINPWSSILAPRAGAQLQRSAFARSAFRTSFGGMVRMVAAYSANKMSAQISTPNQSPDATP